MDYPKDDVEVIQDLRKDASKHQADWRKEARHAYEFRDGDQWDSGDKARLEEQNRPCVTFNRVGPIIDSIVGYEINNRREVRYIPRTMEDRQVSQVYSDAAKWVRDRCNAEDEESDAFRDVVTCGIGWTETRVDYDLDPEGQIVIERVPPLEMRWDPNARKHNLADANWIIREKWWPIADIKERWPDADITPGPDDLNDDDWLEEHDSTEAWKYDEGQSWYDPKSGKALVIQYQCREREEFYQVGDAQSGQVVEFSASRFERLRDKIDQTSLPYVKRSRWVYMQKFIVGSEILEEGPAPIDDGFSFHAMTGKRDEEKGWWYGMVRPMLDPQKWANSFFSQAMHALQANSKGGVMVEESAVPDPREFETRWADPTGVIIVEDGALSSGRIQEKSFGGYPPGFDKLMSFSISAIREVTGVNLELLGMVERDQAGILEQERKQAALTILAPLMNAVKLYRKRQGEALLSFMRAYIQPGTIMRLTNAEVPFWADDEKIKYDVVISDSKTSPNLKQEVWSTLQSVLPTMISSGAYVPPEVIEFSPLPPDVASNWVQQIKERSQMPDMNEINKQMQALQENLQKLQQENQTLKDKREAQAMQLQWKQQEAQMDLQIKQQQMALESRLQEQELLYKMKISDADRVAKLMEIEARYNTEMERIRQQTELQRENCAVQLEGDREKTVVNLQMEREKREAERQERQMDREAEYRASKAPTVEDAQKQIKEMATDFNEYRTTMEANRRIILGYLKGRGGEVAELAEKLEA